jgi:hypothetical protein
MYISLLRPVELGHTNFQIGKEGKAGLRKLGVEPSAPEPPAAGIPEDDGTSVVVSRLAAALQAFRKLTDLLVKQHWHHDSYPFVAYVAMIGL